MHRKSAFSLGISNSNLACVIIDLQRTRKVKKKKKSKFRLSSTLKDLLLLVQTSSFSSSSSISVYNKVINEQRISATNKEMIYLSAGGTFYRGVAVNYFHLVFLSMQSVQKRNFFSCIS